MFRNVSATLICFLMYAVLIVPFTKYLHTRPIIEKLGYVPSVQALKSVALDHKELTAASLVLKVLLYFGGLAQKSDNKIVSGPDYMAMSRILHGSVKLDPYNMDAYYFAQSFLTWDVKKYNIANDLLDYGMKYRTWDWQLPFFAGFNYAYFLKDYGKAAQYYKRAGELSGSDLSIMLAGRYMQESGQTDLAIAYLTSIVNGERNPALKESYETRLRAFKVVKRIEIARDRYFKNTGRMPTEIKQLFALGYLSPLPRDPYGGKFYLEKDGRVVTTSKFAYPVMKK